MIKMYLLHIYQLVGRSTNLSWVRLGNCASPSLDWVDCLHCTPAGSWACPILCGLLWEPRLKEKAAVWASQRLERASGNLQYLSKPWWGTDVWSLLFTMTLIRARPTVEPKVRGGGIHSSNCKITQQGYEYMEGSQVLLEGWYLHLEI